MFDANEWKVANDLTVEDLITYMKNHFNPKAKVNIDGDEIFHIHAELDGSAISFDTSSLEDMEEYAGCVEGTVNMRRECVKQNTSTNIEIYSEMVKDILAFRKFRHDESSDKFRDDYYRVIETNGYDIGKLEDLFNMLHHDGFVFKKAVSTERGKDGKTESITLLIFKRTTEYK